MNTEAAEAASARFKAAMESVYGPYDPEFRNMRAMEAEYADNHFFTLQILHNPGNEYYDAFRRNQARIHQELEKMKKANEEKEQKKEYGEWLERRKAHQKRSTMPFLERPPRVMPSVIKHFEDKNKDEEREALRKQLEDTMMNDDAPLFSNHGTEYPPTHHAHLNPLLPNSASSSTIPPEDKKETAESADLPIRSQSLKPTPVAPPLTDASTAMSARPIIHPYPAKPTPIIPALSDDKSEPVPPKTAPSAHHNPLVPSSSIWSTFLAKYKETKAKWARPIIRKHPAKPMPVTAAPSDVESAESVSSKIGHHTPLTLTSTASSTIPPKDKEVKTKSARKLLRPQSVMPTPVTPAPSDAESEPVPPKTSSAHHNPLVPSSSASSTIPSKDKKEKLSPIRPLIYPLPSNPKPSSSAPTVAVPIPVTSISQNEPSPEPAVPTTSEATLPCSSKELTRSQRKKLKKEKKKLKKEKKRKEQEERRLEGEADTVEDDFIVNDTQKKHQKKENQRENADQKKKQTAKRRRKSINKNPYCR